MSATQQTMGSILRIAIAGVMIALVAVFTLFVRVPIGTGYFNFSDVAIYFASFAFGPWIGLVAGDLVGGLPLAEYEHVAGEMTAEEAWQLHLTPAAVQALPAALRRTVDVDGADVPRLHAAQFEDIGLLIHYTIS